MVKKSAKEMVVHTYSIQRKHFFMISINSEAEALEYLENHRQYEFNPLERW